MATFNTAFGSLSKDMKMQAGLPQLPGTQQLQAQAGVQQPQRPAPQQTFAAMQQQGVARPAPQPTSGQEWPPRPNQQFQPRPDQQFLNRLGQQMNQFARQRQDVGSQQAAFVAAARPILDSSAMKEATTEELWNTRPANLNDFELQREPSGAPGMQAPAPTAAMAPPTQQVAAAQAPAVAQAPATTQAPVATAQAPAAAPTAAPAMPPAPTQAPDTTFTQQLQEQIRQLQQAPSIYGTQEIEQLRQASRADLEAQFGAQRQTLQEELARRGLADSTIAAGRFGDVAGQQARAMASMEADLLTRAAESQQQREQAITGALTTGANIDIRAKELQQQAAQFGESMTLDQARLQAQQEQFAAEQKLAREREIGVIGGKESIAARALTADQQRFEQQLEEQKAARLQQLGISQDQLKLQAEELRQRELLQGREISSQQAMQQVEVDARAKNLATQIEADAKAQGRSITAEQALQEGRIKAEKEMQKERVDQAESQFQQTLTADEQRFAAQLEEQKRAALVAEGFSEREVTLREEAFKEEKEQFDLNLGQRKSEFDRQLELDTDRLGLSATEVANRKEQFDKQFAREKELFDKNLEQRQKELADAEIRFNKTLDEDVRQFDANLKNRRDEVYAQYAGLVRDPNDPSGTTWKQTIQSEAVKGEQQLAKQELLIKLADLLGGRLTDADFADLMANLGLGKNGGGKDNTGTGVTGTGETGTQTKKKNEPPPIDIFDPGYTPQGEIE